MAFCRKNKINKLITKILLIILLQKYREKLKKITKKLIENKQ
jgi:hypothetical protein